MRQKVQIKRWILLWLLIYWLSTSAHAQSIASIVPRTCPPGAVTELTIHGADLNDSMRLATSSRNVTFEIVRVEPTQALVRTTIAAGATLGPLDVAIGFSSGVVQQKLLLIDDLPALTDNAANHSPSTAQSVESMCAIEGMGDGASSDFYRFSIAAGERRAFSIHTQSLRSPLDPVLRLLTSSGSLLVQADDDELGPDCRFEYTFEQAGEYLLEVFDSRYASAGAPYHLRIGDFPLVTRAYPLAVQSANSTQVDFLDQQGAVIASQLVSLPLTTPGIEHLNVRYTEGRTATWVPIWNTATPQINEASTPQEPLLAPIGINGRLDQAGQTDEYRLQGIAGQTLRIAARTHSLGCPTLLKMRLLNSAGTTIAESTATVSDEWAIEGSPAENGELKLQVSDLLHRGGPKFGYAIDVSLANSFSISLKADAAARDQFAVELEHGAAAIDLDIVRTGYAGAIDLQLVDPHGVAAIEGLRIINPRIAAGANSARVYLRATDGWKTGDLVLAKILARPVDLDASSGSASIDTDGPTAATANPTAGQVQVTSRAWQRIKEPFMVNLPSCQEGLFVFSEAASSPPPFALVPATPIELARPVASHSAALTLQRVIPEFKAGVELLPMSEASGWSFSSKQEGDTISLSLQRAPETSTSASAATPVASETNSSEPNTITLDSYGEFNGRGRLARFELPVTWFDPLLVQIEFIDPLIKGGHARVAIHLQRKGNDPQPVTLKFTNLPPGFSAPESLTIAADQTRGEFELAIDPQASLSTNQTTLLVGTSQFAGQEFQTTTSFTWPSLIDGPAELEVFPTEIVLERAGSQQQVVVTGKSANHEQRDWTRQARYRIADPKMVELRDGTLTPLADGQTELIVEVGPQRKVIPVRIIDSQQARPTQFETEVLLALSKQGCNSGACHGSPSGKGGFRLSLRAFDVQLDQLTLIREDFGRRINTLDPEQSLLLLKPLMTVPHGGRKQLRVDDVAYKILRDWIGEGVQVDPAGAPRIVRLEIYPAEKRILNVASGGVQLAVTAHLSDGTRRDVTPLVSYESSDNNVATVDTAGRVTPRGRGEVAILVRCLEIIEAVPLMFVDPQEGFEWQAPPENNYVDTLVNEKLLQLQYPPAEPCSDAEFLRRSSLDVIGILPSVEETQRFLEDPSPDKRARWIDALLERPEYAKFWALKWGDLLRMTGKLVGNDGVYKYHRWVEQSLSENQPYDQFARQLLTSSGSTLANPPANFYRTSADMHESVETISQVFLGARLQCAKCHNHPFERWTQDNYYGLGAFFNRVQRRQTERPGEMFIYNDMAGEVTQPRTGQTMQPWLPQVGSLDEATTAAVNQDRRQAFADWLVAPDNPFFARIEANRLWSHLFARGIVDPIDDFRDSNPPSNAPLLDALAKDFIDSGYDRKHLLRVILNSRTYQAGYQTNEFNREDTAYFSHQQPRLLGAEQVLDAINHTLAIAQPMGNLPAGTLATQLPAPDIAKIDFLKIFGQPERSTVCACERADDSNLGMAIELFNGPLIHEKLRDASNRFRSGLAAGRTVEEVLHELYLAALCRPPADVELAAALEHCSAASDPASGVEDVCWALMNTDEFLFQH